jgi:hypothetical protein
VNATGDISVELVQGVVEDVVGVAGLSHGLDERGFGNGTHTVGDGLGTGNRFLDLRINRELEEAVPDELGKWSGDKIGVNLPLL